MQKGTIVYLADAKTLGRGYDAEAAAAAGGLLPEWTRVAASAPGYDAVADALLDLVRQGAGRVDLIAAQADPDSGLQLLPRRLRLHG
jgi:hypothetical protein